MKLAFNRLFKKERKNTIHSNPEFKKIIDRERERAIRNSGFFSLLVFASGNHEKYTVTDSLVEILKKRTRNIDEIGWYDREKVGVILPQTTHEGALALVADIKGRIGNMGGEVEFEIYTFPDKRKKSRQSISGIREVVHKEGDGDLSDAIGKPIPEWKRAADILGATVLIILLMPLFILIAIYIKIVSPGPVFFKQERLGFMRRPFVCWKFRTMKADADYRMHRDHVADLIRNGKRLSKIDDQPDANIIPFGNFLRKLGIDELPQLYNVLRGDMSLIGPRPCLDYEAAEFIEWQNRRFDVHPGLTGLWQVSGKNHTTFEEMMRLDIRYGQERSLLHDLMIFLRTFPAVLKQATENILIRGKVDYER